MVLTQPLALEWVAVVLVDILEMVVMLDPLMVILLEVILLHLIPIPFQFLDKPVPVVEVVVRKAPITASGGGGGGGVGLYGEGTSGGVTNAPGAHNTNWYALWGRGGSTAHNTGLNGYSSRPTSSPITQIPSAYGGGGPNTGHWGVRTTNWTSLPHDS